MKSFCEQLLAHPFHATVLISAFVIGVGAIINFLSQCVVYGLYLLEWIIDEIRLRLP